jgi:hypothetical protein
MTTAGAVEVWSQIPTWSKALATLVAGVGIGITAVGLPGRVANLEATVQSHGSRISAVETRSEYQVCLLEAQTLPSPRRTASQCAFDYGQMPR